MSDPSQGERRGAPLAALLAVFALSGATGLVYELVWTRALRLLVGSTTLSLTIVLAAFMGGLALGAWAAGRRIDATARPLRVYAWLEVAIGAWGLLVPLLARAVDPLIGALYRSLADRPELLAVSELFVLAPIVLPGSALMGATLPALGRAVAGPSVARSGGLLYAVNTLGAAAGAALAGFALVPTIGLFATTAIAVATNGALAALVLVVDRRLADAATPAAVVAAAPATTGRAAALAVFLAGLAGMTLQIAWTRLFVTSVGSSTYAFTGVVSVYILGIGLGAAAGARATALGLAPARLLALACAGAALAAAATGPFFAALPGWVAAIVREEKGAIPRILAREVWLVALALFPATALLGATFPLGVAAAGGAPDRPGRALGRISTASSLGSIAGALAVGLVLLPLLGLGGALKAGVALAAAAAVAAGFALDAPAARARNALFVIAGATVVVYFLETPDARLLDGGAYLYGARTLAEAERRQTKAVLARAERIVRRAEGDDLTAAVYGRGCDEILVINGKVDASSQADSESQLLVGHLPILLRGPGTRKVCVIGLGSGMTCGAVLAHPDVERLDVVEISPTVALVVKATRLFDLLAHGALGDKRTRLLIADGRTHLAHAAERYDVIISQPTNPWIAGVGDLFTREHFARSRERLEEGGLLGQWLQGYSTTPEVFAVILRTFRDVFPNAQLWRFGQGDDFLLVGTRSGEEPKLALETVRAELARNERLRASLADASVQQAESLLWFFSLDPKGLAAVTGEGPRNTDDSGWLEFHAPFHLFSQAEPLDERAREEEARATSPFTDARPHELDRIRRARPLYYQACKLRRTGQLDSLLEADKLLRDALQQAPPAPGIVLAAHAHVNADRIRLGAIKEPVELAKAVEEIGRARVSVPQVLATFAQAAWRVGRADESERAYKRLLELRPTWDRGRALLATILIGRRAHREVLEVLKPIDRDEADVLVARGVALAGLGEQGEARAVLDKALASLARKDAPVADDYDEAIERDTLKYRAWLTSGLLRARAGEKQKACEDFAQAVQAKPLEPEGWFDFALALTQAGDKEKALVAVKQALDLKPGDARARALLESLER